MSKDAEAIFSMRRIRRQAPFLRSLVREAESKERQSLLRAANKDQINAVSEVVLNALTNRDFPHRPHTLARLRPHKRVLRELKRKKNSVKKRRNILLRQRGGRFWSGLDQTCQCLHI